MRKEFTLFKHQSSQPRADCGWTLPPMGARTLSAPTGGVLHVRSGRVWATLDGPHAGPANDWGDRVLHAGQRLSLHAGERVVLEGYGDADARPAELCWEPGSGARPGAGGQPWQRPLAALRRLATPRRAHALAWAGRLG